MILQDCQMLGPGKYPIVYLYTKVPSVQHLTGDVRVNPVRLAGRSGRSLPQTVSYRNIVYLL